MRATKIVGAGLVLAGVIAGHGWGGAAPTAPATRPASGLAVPSLVALTTDGYDVIELPPLTTSNGTAANLPRAVMQSVALAVSPTNKVVGYTRVLVDNTVVAVRATVWSATGEPSVAHNCPTGIARDVAANDMVVGTCNGLDAGFVGPAVVSAAVFGAGPGGKAVGRSQLEAWVSSAGGDPVKLNPLLNTGGGAVAPYVYGGAPLRPWAFDMNANRKTVGIQCGPQSSPATSPTEGFALAILWSDKGEPSALPGRAACNPPLICATNAARAYAINDKDVVVGRVGFGGASNERAARWQNGQLSELGSLGGRSGAVGINNRGVIVGWSYDADGDMHAFIHKDNTLRDLNTLVHRAPAKSSDGTWNAGAEWILGSANGINEAGWICGQGTKDGKVRGFLLKPRATPSSVLSAEALKALIKTAKPTRALEDKAFAPLTP